MLTTDPATGHPPPQTLSGTTDPATSTEQDHELLGLPAWEFVCLGVRFPPYVGRLLATDPRGGRIWDTEHECGERTIRA